MALPAPIQFCSVHGEGTRNAVCGFNDTTQFLGDHTLNTVYDSVPSTATIMLKRARGMHVDPMHAPSTAQSFSCAGF